MNYDYLIFLFWSVLINECESQLFVSEEVGSLVC